ncbi:MAG: flavodoxin [Erysipelotrichaceae bacterium]|nr:flavodoxin [Erysipelotrichaceae bacterium]
MKKNMILKIVIVVLLVFISGCTHINDSNVAENEEIVTTENNTDDETTGNSNILVVYYSATSKTERVAEIIAENTNADLFEIEPVDPYTDEDLNWTNENSRVTQEYEDETLRDVELVTTSVDNWNDYDTVFIGYPIWWGIAAWPTNNFVIDNDFSNKIVIPFCTSSSSGLGQRAEILKDLAGSGNWQEGQRFQYSTSEDIVTSWLEEIGF